MRVAFTYMKERLRQGLEFVASLPFTAFSTGVRKEIGKRDHWQCQADICFWERVTGKPARFQDGFMVEAAHYPHKHNGHVDEDSTNGRILCTVDHAIEELHRGNEGGARLLLSRGIYTWDYAKKHHKQVYYSVDKLKKLLEAQRHLA